MAKDEIKSNKHSKVPKGPDIVTSSGMPGRFNGIKATQYNPPPEEKEHVLDKIPGPDFKIETKDDQ